MTTSLMATLHAALDQARRGGFADAASTAALGRAEAALRAIVSGASPAPAGLRAALLADWKQDLAAAELQMHRAAQADRARLQLLEAAWDCAPADSYGADGLAQSGLATGRASGRVAIEG